MTQETYTQDELLELLKKQIEEEGSLYQWAKKNDVKHSYVWNIVNGRTTPGPSVLKVLGLRKVVTYVRDQ